MEKSGKVSGWIYFIMGILLLVLQCMLLKNIPIEPYRGWYSLQLLWLGFGAALIVVAGYIIIAN